MDISFPINCEHSQLPRWWGHDRGWSCCQKEFVWIDLSLFFLTSNCTCPLLVLKRPNRQNYQAQFIRAPCKEKDHLKERRESRRLDRESTLHRALDWPNLEMRTLRIPWRVVNSRISITRGSNPQPLSTHTPHSSSCTHTYMHTHTHTPHKYTDKGFRKPLIMIDSPPRSQSSET